MSVTRDFFKEKGDCHLKSEECSWMFADAIWGKRVGHFDTHAENKTDWWKHQSPY